MGFLETPSQILDMEGGESWFPNDIFNESLIAPLYF